MDLPFIPILHELARYIGDPNVLMYLSNLREDQDDPRRRDLFLGGGYMRIGVLEALYATHFLRWRLSEDRNATDDAGNGPLTTVLSLDHGDFSEAAIDVFCTYLQETTLLRSLKLSRLPTGHMNRLLDALQFFNTSVKDIEIMNWDGLFDDASAATRIARLLLSKPDLEAIGFGNANPRIFPWANALYPGLACGHPHLQKLSFHGCRLQEEGTQLMVHALEEGDFSALRELDLKCNQITPRGLSFLCRLIPAVLPSLHKILLNHNPNVLDDADISERFAQTVLLAQDTMVQELYIADCSHVVGGYIKILKALEDPRCKLRLLDMTVAVGAHDVHILSRRPIFDQLVESIPKMKRLEHLSCDVDYFIIDNYGNNVWNGMALLAALRQNTSFLVITTTGQIQIPSPSGYDGMDPPHTPSLPLIEAVLERNKTMAQVDVLLGNTTTTTTRTNTFCHNVRLATRDRFPYVSTWCRILAKVGQGTQGATPVFTIVRDRFATWKEEE